ncbi:MAG: 2-deoxyribose-5-phosphate aldolase [Bacilli bacterium]|nr:2-deoxyribose-5-phosphate aldolase [Bacilli bacterium]
MEDCTSPISNEKLASMIDHTLLKPDAVQEQIIQLCEEAKKFGFASVCVQPSYCALAKEQLLGTQVAVCTVLGFPLGATLPAVKAYECESVLAAGASEVDMVIEIGWLKSRNYEGVLADIRGVVAAAAGKALVKVILETSLLSEQEKVIGSLLAQEAGADFVKTSTGFAGGGATEADIRLLRRTVGPSFGVKASGGIRTRQDAEAMIRAGATRIGASSSVTIIQGSLRADSSDY